jgi:hypothetical protein
MSGRAWTTREDAFLRRHRGRLTTVEIARRLERGKSGVYRRVVKLGMARKRPFRWTVRIKATVAGLHRRGWSDTEIAAAVGIADRHTVARWRRRRGLQANIWSEHLREKTRQNTRQQLRRAGVVTLKDLQRAAWARRARALGWPEDLRFRAVEILEVLWQRGPMTRRQIAACVGMPWKGPRKSLHSNDREGSYLAYLMARGLVVCQKRVLQQGGQGKNVSLYMLPLGVEPGPSREPNHERSESCEAMENSSARTRAARSPGRNGCATPCTTRSRRRISKKSCRRL